MNGNGSSGSARSAAVGAPPMDVDSQIIPPPPWPDPPSRESTPDRQPARQKRRTGEEEFATRSDLREMLEHFKSELMAANAQNAERSIGNLLRKYDDKVQERMDKLEHDHLELEDRVAKMEAKLRAQEARLQKTDQEIATFSSADPIRAIRDEAWDRSPDAIVLKLNASSMVAMVARAKPDHADMAAGVDAIRTPSVGHTHWIAGYRTSYSHVMCEGRSTGGCISCPPRGVGECHYGTRAILGDTWPSGRSCASMAAG